APSVIPNTGGQTVTLRSPDEFRRHLASLKGAIESTKATELSSFAGKDDAERAQTKQKIIDATRRNLDFLGIEYTAQIRLLELDVDDAKSAAKAAEEQRTSAEQRYKTGEI